MAAAGAKAAGCGAEASCPWNFLLHALGAETEIQAYESVSFMNDEVLKVFFVSCLFDFNITSKG